MFTVMQPTPVFSFGLDASVMSPSYYRPAAPSPLSSSPLRASSASPPSALASRDPNALPRLRDTQSSPIPATKQQFKYATRNPRPNPVVKRREDAQESRRRLFLQNVRQRADDQKWEKRGGENELLKLEWSRINREWRQARESDIDSLPREDEIDDEPLPDLGDADSLMLDAIEREEEAEMNALLSAIPADAEFNAQKESEMSHFSDDDEYDDIFMEFLSEQDGQGIVHSQDMEMS